MPVTISSPTFASPTAHPTFEETRAVAKGATGLERVCDRALSMFKTIIGVVRDVTPASLRTATSLGYIAGAIVAASIYTGKLPPNQENLQFVASSQKDTIKALASMNTETLTSEQVKTTCSGLAGSGLALGATLALVGIGKKKSVDSGLA